VAIVYIGIGSNTGDREDNCRKAIGLLGGYNIKVVRTSSMYETEPWGVKDQPRFINMAVEIETDLEPRNLLNALKDIEKKMKRVPSERYGPRLIDLDILLYNDLVMDEPDLKIPHSHMHERDFVVKPLMEIAPEAVHPTFGKKITELFSQIHRSS
jgi:2-amino-4-hydroxy-6-hydroxymethyldihydropteridine diphosphokinase